MVDLVVLDGSPGAADKPGKKSGKRKKSLFGEKMSKEERDAVISDYRREVESLFGYMKEFLGGNVDLGEISGGGALRLSNMVVACLLEESSLPFSKLVQEVYGRLKLKDGVTLAAVESAVLNVGQRGMYGVGKADANLLEDESESCNWCWETRELKFLPKSQRGIFSIRHSCRRRIHERITALQGMIAALSEPEMGADINVKFVSASEKLGRTLNESQLRSLAESMLQKNGAEMTEKEAKLKEKELLREMERIKKEAEKKQKLMERELLKEKLQSEKEQKKLQDEAEKERRRLEEAEKDQKRREKEQSELKKKLCIQKQATMMERFLKRQKVDADSQDSKSSSPSSQLPEKAGAKSNAVTSSMDSVLWKKHEADSSDILKSHLATWQKLSHSIRCNKCQHWGIRRKPKTSHFKELRLLGSPSEAVTSMKVTTPKANTEPRPDNFLDMWEVASSVATPSSGSAGIAETDARICGRRKKLLQFDKSYRPAYYGTLSRKSDIIGPRCPLRKDPNLDYDIDSDEEWEEEDPGESLSDCNKDDEEDSLEEGKLSYEDEDASEDSFMVPDGYLSENEGVQGDSEEINDECKSTPTYCRQEEGSEEFRDLIQNQTYLNNLTERALRKNTPLIILNLMHEKSSLAMIDNPSGNSRHEQMCLQALSIRPCYGGAHVQLSIDHSNLTNEDRDVCHSQSQANFSTTPVTGAVILDTELLKVVTCIQSGASGISKIMELLQQNFPGVSKTQLRQKVREIADFDFVDNRWQVKKEVLSKLEISTSPEIGTFKTKGIAMFFSKRCMSSSDRTLDVDESSPPCKKLNITHLDEDCNSQNVHLEESGNRA